MDESACNGNPLFLTAGEITAVFSHCRLQPVRQGGEVIQKSAVFQRFFYLLFGKRISKSDIVADRAVKKINVLFNVGNPAVQRIRVNVPGVGLVKINIAGIILKMPQDQMKKCTFSTAGRSHQRIFFSFHKFHVQMRENRFAGIRKRDILKRDFIFK